MTTCYSQFDGLLVLYGSGGADRKGAISLHKGHWVAFDLGYWNRNEAFRVSINSEHPTAAQLAKFNDPSRLEQLGIRLRKDYQPKGHIVLVGMGRKSRIWYDGWEAEQLRKIRKAYPGREVFFRPKPGSPAPHGVDCYHFEHGSIEDVLAGAALVVCRHSNVAVDACIAGVPVVCEGGAAAALYGNDLKRPHEPTPVERLQFLQRLAWWQWSSTQIQQGEFWPWLEAALYA